jgi:hypothetical protein
MKMESDIIMAYLCRLTVIPQICAREIIELHPLLDVQRHFRPLQRRFDGDVGSVGLACVRFAQQVLHHLLGVGVDDPLPADDNRVDEVVARRHEAVLHEHRLVIPAHNLKH